MISERQVLCDYNRIKKIAIKTFNKGQYQKCLELIRFIANLMYHFNIIYSDDEIEDILLRISSDYTVHNFELDKNVVLFYDWWGLETRGLTNINLQALIKNNYRIVFVTQKKNQNNIGWVKKLFEGTDNVAMCIDDYGNFFSDLTNLQKIYSEYKPGKALLHTMPDDVVGVLFFNTIKSTRFQINLTDHAFWLGTKCFDFSIEFRDFGYSISLQERKISDKKLLVLPYYPISISDSNNNDSKSFIDSVGKYFFSGGSLYKISGNAVFLDFVRDILILYPDLSFVYIGNGDSSFFIKYFKDCNLSNRVYLFAERKDFIDFYDNCEFYLDTFPINGALMTQYAVLRGAVPVSFNFSDKNICTDCDISGLFTGYDDSMKLSFNNVEDAKEEVFKLLKNDSYRMEKRKQIKNLVISEDKFQSSIYDLLENNKTDFSCSQRKLDLKSFSKVYIDSVGKKKNKYFLIYSLSRNKYIYFYCILYSVKGFFNKSFLKLIGDKLKCKFHF